MMNVSRRLTPGKPFAGGPPETMRRALDWLTDEPEEQVICIRHLHIRARRVGTSEKSEISWRYFDAPFLFARGKSEELDELRHVDGNARPPYHDIEVERASVRETKRRLLIHQCRMR